MEIRTIARHSGNVIVSLFAFLLLQGCGLKGDLYLEDDEDAAAATSEQEAENLLDKSPGESSAGEGTEEFPDDMLEEQSEDIASRHGSSPENGSSDNSEDSREEKPAEIIEEQ